MCTKSQLHNEKICNKIDDGNENSRISFSFWAIESSLKNSEGILKVRIDGVAFSAVEGTIWCVFAFGNEKRKDWK